MTNHTPTITSSSATGSFSENANTTGSTALHSLSGTMNFTDSDHSDTHTTSASLKSAVLSSGTVIPASSLAHFNTAMSSTIQSDSNGSGKLKWSFSDEDDDFDFLAKNQSLTLTYNIKVSDNHGGSTTQTVTITVTGTDDKPMFATSVAATVTEQTDHTLSLSPDTAHIAVAFTDPDLTNTGHTAQVTGVTASGVTSGILPGSFGTAELMAFFHVDNVVKASGSSSGTINTTFSAPDLAFDYLAAGEEVHLTYAVQLDDHAGGVSNQTVVVTVVGTNDKPVYICGPESAHLVEGQNLTAGNLTAHGDLLFGDIDLSDTHTVSTTATATRSGGGAVPLTNAQLIAAMHTTLDDSNGTLLGDVAWNFALADSSVNFLQASETLTITYNLTIKDPSNATDTETVTITILGTNHPVVITSGPESGSLSETADTTGSAALDTTTPVPTGTLAFTDQDTGDTHSVLVSVASATWSGGSVPADTLSALPSALLTTLHDSTGTGTGGVDWTFSIADNKLDFLSAGETLTVTYNVKVSDASTNATQTVTVTVNGANDAPTITSGPGSASVAELPNTFGSSTLDTTSPVPTGTLAFSDVDLTGTHLVAISISSLVWSAGPELNAPPQTQADLMTALATTLHDSTGSGSGGVDWSFSIPDQDLDFLAAGETLTVTYDVTVSDAVASSTQTVTITMTGAEDGLMVNAVNTDVTDTFFPEAGNQVAFGNAITDVGDSGGDANTTLMVTDVNGSASNVGTSVAGTYGSLFLSSDGSYQYTANASFDALQVGDNPTDQFNFTVTDSLNRTETTTLTFHITGGDDAPTITAADTAGSMTEDRGPSTVVNGGFETGDLTGWTASSSLVHAAFVGNGGEFGNYAAELSPTFTTQTLSQAIATAPGQHYTLSFFIAGDSEAGSNSISVEWDGITVLALADVFSGGYVHYSFDVIGDASLSTTSLQFSYADDGIGMHVDEVKVEAASGPPTESSDGTIAFADVETSDTHTASFVPQSADYLGTFSLDPVSETPGSGSVAWHFTVNNSDIQFLAQDQTLTQVYTVLVTDDHGVSGTQDVTITINGTNDAPTAVSENVITDVGTGGTVDIPAWALAANDTDPDTTDTLSANAILSSTGGTAAPFGDAFFIDDGTLGGSFTYNTTDGIAVSGNAATATIVNNATSVTSLTGTSGDDILIGNNGSEALNGGGGNDILIGNAGSHVLTGGSGDDIFAFQQTTDGPNTITDFNNVTAHDTVAIAASGFGLTPGQDPSTVFESSDDDQFIFANFHYDNANQTLYYSPDGTTASATVVAQFQPGVALHANDLLIV
jgi:VCBS repeat-containing protein